VAEQKNADVSAWSSFMTGLPITPGEQKAILFYLGFFPAFMDLKALTVPDALIVIAIAAVAVGGVKLGYAWVASVVRMKRSVAQEDFLQGEIRGSYSRNPLRFLRATYPKC